MTNAAANPLLDHIPGEDGWPIFGTVLEQLRDPRAFARRMVARYGPVYRNRSFGQRWVVMVGAEANEMVLLDRDMIFSSEQGWGPMLGRLFPNGLMLMDGEAHRAHRRMLGVAFKPPPMRHFAGVLEAGIAERVACWSGREILLYPEVKQLTLDLAASFFLGLPLGPEATRINQAFTREVAASIGIVRRPVPFTAMARGVAGRRYLIELFKREVPRRRESGGEDLFSQICRATDDNGQMLDDQQIADHMNLMMIAAHDTITSSLTSLVWQLGVNPEWQDRLREEVEASEDAETLPLCDCAFRETLRISAPVPSLPRRAMKPFRFGGYEVPAGAYVIVSPSFVHHMDEYWSEPTRFDPTRFAPEAVRTRHKYAWVPFGGGAHMCLGLHLAMMQARLFLKALLPEHRICLIGAQPTRWQAWPIPKPRDGLPVRLERV